VCYLHFAHEAAGATGTRHSPGPRLGGSFLQNPARWRRENAAVYPRHCEEQRDEAIQLSFLRIRGLLRFARNDGWAMPCKPPSPLSHRFTQEMLLTTVLPIAISTPPGTSGLLALGWILENDGIDTIERRPRRPPQAAIVSLLASRNPRNGPHPRPLCRRCDCRAVG